MVCKQTSPKRWFGNVNMTSYCDVKNSVYPVIMTTIRHCLILEVGRWHPIKQSPRASPELCTRLMPHATSASMTSCNYTIIYLSKCIRNLSFMKRGFVLIKRFFYYWSKWNNSGPDNFADNFERLVLLTASGTTVVGFMCFC